MSQPEKPRDGTLMDIWGACQPVRVTPHPDDVMLDGYRYRKTADGWIYYNPQAGDWYRANPDLVPRLDPRQASLASPLKDLEESVNG